MKTDEYPRQYLYRQVVQAKLFIDIHFADKLDLRGISSQAYFSKFHFIRLFKSIYASTPHQYLTRVRVEKAKALLQTGCAVEEACYAVGFDSVSTFSGLFKRYTSVSPSAYQEQQRQRHREIIDRPLKFVPNCFAEQNGWADNRNFEEVK